jgi:hypothetical protein
MAMCCATNSAITATIGTAFAMLFVSISFKTMTEEQLNLHKADQQLTGFAHARGGYQINSLAAGMGLTKKEWEALKKDFLVLDYLTEEEVQEIEDHLNEC